MDQPVDFQAKNVFYNAAKFKYKRAPKFKPLKCSFAPLLLKSSKIGLARLDTPPPNYLGGVIRNT